MGVRMPPHFMAYHCHHNHCPPKKILSEVFPAIPDQIITGKQSERLNSIIFRAHDRKHLAIDQSNGTRPEIPWTRSCDELPDEIPQELDSVMSDQNTTGENSQRINLVVIRWRSYFCKYQRAPKSPPNEDSSKSGFRVMIPRSWYRAQKPLKPGNTKKIRKSYEIPHPGWGPENTKKSTEKIRKRSFLGHFRIFSVFFSYFRGPTRGGGFRNFFVFFSYFRAWGAFGVYTRNAESQIQGEFLQFSSLLPWTSCFLSAIVAPNICVGDPFEWVPLLKCLVLMVGGGGQNLILIHLLLISAISLRNLQKSPYRKRGEAKGDRLVT